MDVIISMALNTSGTRQNGRCENSMVFQKNTPACSWKSANGDLILVHHKSHLKTSSLFLNLNPRCQPLFFFFFGEFSLIAAIGTKHRNTPRLRLRMFTSCPPYWVLRRKRYVSLWTVTTSFLVAFLPEYQLFCFRAGQTVPLRQLKEPFFCRNFSFTLRTR